MWIALQAWLSKGGLERQEVPDYNSEIIQLVCSGGEETFATREVQLDGDPVLQARLFQQFLHFNIFFRRVVRYNPMVGPEMEEEVERLFYTPTPARFSLLLLISSSFNLSIRSPHTLLFAFGGWSRTGSGDAATFGPSSDIMIFNPATRFKAKCHPFSHRHTRSWSKMEPFQLLEYQKDSWGWLI